MNAVELSSLHPPRRLQLIWCTNAGEEATYSGHLASVSADRLSIQLLGYGLVPSALRAGESVQVQIPDGAGVLDFPSQVVTEDISGDLQVLVTGDVRRLERRRFPRARVSMSPTTAFVLDHPMSPPRPMTVRIVEIGGGGARFECYEPLAAGQVVQILVPVPEHPPIFAILTVLDTATQPSRPGARGNLVVARSRFARILQSDRGLILQYVAREREFSGAPSSSAP